MEIRVHFRIIQSKNFTIPKCTRRSFVKVIRMDLAFANMEIIVLSRTLNLKYRLTWLISSRGTQISTCSTLRRHGAPTRRKTTIGKLACTHTTGRTSAASPIYLLTGPNNVRLGILRIKLLNTVTPVEMDYIAQTATAGRNLNTTQISSGKTSATSRNAKIRTVPSTISRRRGERIASSSSTCLDVVRLALLQACTCRI